MIGRLVIAILNEKVKRLNISKEEALSQVYANELISEDANLVTQNVKDWLGHDTDWKCYCQDAVTWKPDFEYDYVLTNLPFGSWRHSTLPRQIVRNLVKR
nr:MAG TPA: N-6 DNA Methylase [Caudoviricetes sp.]